MCLDLCLNTNILSNKAWGQPRSQKETDDSKVRIHSVKFVFPVVCEH